MSGKWPPLAETCPRERRKAQIHNVRIERAELAFEPKPHLGGDGGSTLNIDGAKGFKKLCRCSTIGTVIPCASSPKRFGWSPVTQISNSSGSPQRSAEYLSSGRYRLPGHRRHQRYIEEAELGGTRSNRFLTRYESRYFATTPSTPATGYTKDRKRTLPAQYFLRCLYPLTIDICAP
jgi:hypothetical protein